MSFTFLVFILNGWFSTPYNGIVTGAFGVVALVTFYLAKYIRERYGVEQPEPSELAAQITPIRNITMAAQLLLIVGVLIGCTALWASLTQPIRQLLFAGSIVVILAGVIWMEFLAKKYNDLLKLHGFYREQ